MDTVIEQINCINWHDFRLDAISINYEDAVIYFSSENEQQYNIQCKNFIGIQYYGQWDECIIRNISVKTSSVFIDENRKVVKQNNPVNLCGGGVRKCDGVWYECHLLGTLQIQGFSGPTTPKQIKCDLSLYAKRRRGRLRAAFLRG